MRKVRFNPIERTKLAKRTPSSRDGTRALKHFFEIQVPCLFFLESKAVLEIHVYRFCESRIGFKKHT